MNRLVVLACVALPLTGQPVPSNTGNLQESAFSPDRFVSITGQVIDAVRGAPIAQVEIVLRSADSSPLSSSTNKSFTAVTGADGRFSISAAAGRYVLSAKRAGFIAAEYGSTSGRHSGTTLDVSPGQSLNSLTV